jgi:hypothetical protein
MSLRQVCSKTIEPNSQGCTHKAAPRWGCTARISSACCSTRIKCSGSIPSREITTRSNEIAAEPQRRLALKCRLHCSPGSEGKSLGSEPCQRFPVDLDTQPWAIRHADDAASMLDRLRQNTQPKDPHTSSGSHADLLAYLIRSSCLEELSGVAFATVGRRRQLDTDGARIKSVFRSV